LYDPFFYVYVTSSFGLIKIQQRDI
jgi:hypothetical protein